jgi:molybdate transport system ATP-binding protein
MASEMIVELRKSFPGRLTVDLNLEVTLEPPSILILFGPSGSGKTTVLRCLAGLEWPERGLIRFRGDIWLDTGTGVKLSPQHRALGYMSQDYSLFPTYSVAGNIAFGLGSLTSAQRQARVAEVLALLQLHGVEHLRPAQLSGGQQQRVALARTIARRPSLLLLDEPLSALDLPTRAKLRGELRNLLKHLAIPSIVVTHDWEEAIALGDQLAVLSEGRLLQMGSPQEVFSRPLDAEVARIVGMETVIPGRIVGSVDGLVTLEVAGVKLLAVGDEEEATEVFVCIRAEDVVLESVGVGMTSARNHLVGTVREISSLGALVRVGIDCGFTLSAMVTRSALDELHLALGATVVAAIKAGAVHVVPRSVS